MQHYAALVKRLNELGVFHKPWGEHRISVMRRDESGEDVMIGIEEPRRFGSYFVTELFGVVSFFGAPTEIPVALAAELLTRNHKIPYGHWSIAPTIDGRISVQFVVKFLTPEDPYAPDTSLFAMAISGIVETVSGARSLFPR